MQTLNLRQARRLALLRAGLLKPALTGLPQRASGTTGRAKTSCLRIVERFGYLQLDTVSVAGARSHAIVLASRLRQLDTRIGEGLLNGDGALFEYWGHEACWIPISLYPCFGFRRREFRVHPWWGDILGEHRGAADALLARIAEQGPLRSVDLDGEGPKGWWDTKLSKRIAEALWSSGELAIRERRNFQRVYDLTERVIPRTVREQSMGAAESLDALMLKALDGHGWATTGTLAATWRMVNKAEPIRASLHRLQSSGRIIACGLVTPGRLIPGWIQPRDLERIAQLDSMRPRRDRGVLLSPFDPLLWDRKRTSVLFGFEQTLEIYKPAPNGVTAITACRRCVATASSPGSISKRTVHAVYSMCSRVTTSKTKNPVTRPRVTSRR